MPSENTLRDYPRPAAPIPRSADGRPAVQPPQILPQRKLGRVWLAVNLLALAAVGTALGDAAATPLFVGWVSFALLNSALYLCIRQDWMSLGEGQSIAEFEHGVAAICGAAWGGGIALLLPATTVPGASVLFAAAFAVALAAIPVFANGRQNFSWFLILFTALAVIGIVRDGRFAMAVMWLAFASASLLILAAGHHHAQDRLRVALRDLVGAGATHRPQRQPATHDEALIAEAGVQAAKVAELTAAHQQQHRVVAALGVGVVVTDADGHVDGMNAVAEALTGWQQHESRGRPVEDIVQLTASGEQNNLTRAIFDQAQDTLCTQRSAQDAQLWRKDGSVHGVDCVASPVMDDADAFNGIAYVLHDVTAQRLRSEAIAWQASHDPLTGVINRREFERRLKKLLGHARHDDTRVHALLYIDVDRFKLINDTYGHAAGDAALESLAEIMRTRIRDADTLARIGGDEFAALLYSCSQDKARAIAENLRAAVAHHAFLWQGITLHLSLSIGIVEIDRNARNADSLLRAVDSACYAAKQGGRNCIQVRGPTDSDDGQTRGFCTVKQLQSAIRDNRLELSYRTLRETGANGRAVASGCELGVGIRDADGTLLRGAELDALLERYQLGLEVNRRAIETAADALRDPRSPLAAGGLVLLPLSRQALADQTMAQWIDEFLGAHPDTAPRFGFTFDAATLAGDDAASRYLIGLLGRHGCRFMLDDLGIGSAALDLLRSEHIDFLALRGALVQQVTHDSAAFETVLGLCRIAATRNIAVAARDVEDTALATTLGKMGVNYVLGQAMETLRA